MITHARARDAQAVLCDLLRPIVGAAHPGAHVGAVRPATAHPVVVTVRRDGGPQVDEAQHVARVGINVWTDTEEAAFDVAALVAKALLEAPDGTVVLGVEAISGPQPIVDETTQPHIYQTFDVVLSGV